MSYKDTPLSSPGILIKYCIKESAVAEEIVGTASQGPEEGFSMEATTSESTSSPHQNIQNFQGRRLDLGLKFIIFIR